MKRILTLIVGLAAFLALAVVLAPIAIRLREPADGRALAAGVPGRLIDVGGRRVHIVERGAGPPLLLVHGFGGSTMDYEEFVLEPLAQSRRAIAVDLFGFGWSERSDDFAYGFALWSDQLADALYPPEPGETRWSSGCSARRASASWRSRSSPTRARPPEVFVREVLQGE